MFLPEGAFTWWTFWIFFIFFCLGEGKGESEARSGGVGFSIDNPRRGSPTGGKEGGGDSSGRVSAGNGGGGLFFFRGRNSHQV